MRLGVGLLLVVLLGASAPAFAQDAKSTPRSDLAVQLREAQADRAGTTLLWPGLMIGAGAASILTGAIVGIAHTVDCHGSCSAPAWISVLVVAGAGVGSVGTVWFVNTDHNLAQLDAKISILQQDIERTTRRSSLDQRELALRSDATAFALTFDF